MPAVSADQMREIDRIAIEESGPNLFQMMENAGRNLVLQTLDLLARILALDVPSGLDATSGETPGRCIRAYTTLTLALPKRGLGGETTGELWLADLGIPRGTYERAGGRYPDPFGSS